MTNKDKEAILDLLWGNISERAFISLFSITRENYSEFVRETLLNSLHTKDPDDVEYPLLLISFFKLYEEFLNDIFCKLLVEDWHYKHEDLVLAIENIQLKGCEENLYILAQKQLAYLEYDDNFGLARKCTWALAKINSPAAMEKLQLLAEIGNESVKGYARKRLSGFTDGT
jgi:hypothetical protein